MIMGHASSCFHSAHRGDSEIINPVSRVNLTFIPLLAPRGTLLPAKADLLTQWDDEVHEVIDAAGLTCQTLRPKRLAYISRPSIPQHAPGSFCPGLIERSGMNIPSSRGT